jgi:hypothetical protein
VDEPAAQEIRVCQAIPQSPPILELEYAYPRGGPFDCRDAQPVEPGERRPSPDDVHLCVGAEVHEPSRHISSSVRIRHVRITLPRRFRGPVDSANGGYAGGRLAAFVDGNAAEVTLRRPPPLDRPLEVGRDSGVVLLLDGESLVAEARPALLDLELPSFVSLEEAETASSRHVRIGEELFAECFSCGVREDGDGLRVHAGAVVGREPLHAAVWDVHETGPEIVWAAIDCSGAYAVGSAGRGAVVLGQMAARVLGVPEVGDRCVVVAWPLGEEGRKLYAGTALFTAEGEPLAYARQTWILPRTVSEG